MDAKIALNERMVIPYDIPKFADSDGEVSESEGFHIARNLVEYLETEGSSRNPPFVLMVLMIAWLELCHPHCT